MSSLKQLKQEQKNALLQRQVISELNALVADVGRCEKTINDLKGELEAVNTKHQKRNGTREDIAYLEDLLKCAKKKLAWEKHMASLQKRTPDILQRFAALLNDPVAPPSDEVRGQMLACLQSVQSAMERLQSAKVD